MYPRSFEYVAPASLEEALDLLAGDAGAKIISGGMSLLPLMKTRLLSPALLVDLGRIPDLDYVTEDPEHVALGALVRHRRTASDPIIVRHAPALARAAALTGDPQVRNRGTTCGAVAHGDLAGDQPAAVLAVGATIVVQSRSGVRPIPAAEFFRDAFLTALEPDEVVVEIRIARAADGESSVYEKLGRRGGHNGFPIAGVAAWVRKQDGIVTAARIALTGVGTHPVVASGVGEALAGTDGSAGAVAAAAARATEGVTVLEDLYGSTDYKAHLARVLTQRALTAALSRV